MFIYFPRSTTYLLVNLAFNAVILGGAVVTRCPFFGQDCCSIKNLNKLADVVEPMTIALFSSPFRARTNWSKMEDPTKSRLPF